MTKPKAAQREADTEHLWVFMDEDRSNFTCFIGTKQEALAEASEDAKRSPGHKITVGFFEPKFTAVISNEVVFTEV